MQVINTVEDFKQFVGDVEAQDGYVRPFAFAVGIATKDMAGNILDTRYLCVNREENYGTAAVLADVVGHLSGSAHYMIEKSDLLKIIGAFWPFQNDGKNHQNFEAFMVVAEFLKGMERRQREGVRADKVILVTFLDESTKSVGPRSIPDAYLRLHLLSYRKVKPNEVSFEGLFGILPNNVWTSEGPVSDNDLSERQLAAMTEGRPFFVRYVDKIPYMLDYVRPEGVRVADGSRVRLGAHLSPGTTVMQEGFCNFNAGTLGASMIEGRISQGVIVGDQTDIGGGASIMGTLSGGGTERISIGRGCLLGANSGTGISLGDLCVIEAGLYVTAGMPVFYNGDIVKAVTLSGKNGLTFRREGGTGQVQVLERPNKVKLNELLHH